MNFDIRYTGISQKSWNSATYSDGTDTTLPMTAVAMQTASPVIIVIISTAMLVFVTCFILSQRVKTESSAFADFLETMPLSVLSLPRRLPLMSLYFRTRTGYFASLIFAGFFALGIPFFELWIPGQDISLVYSLTMIGIVGSFFEGLVNPLYYIYTLTLKNKVPTAITVIGGVVSVIGTVVLLEFTDLGVYGCAITTTAVTSLIAIVTNPLYMTHVLGISHMTFYPTFARSFLACVLMSFAFSAVSCLAAPVNWASFILCVLLCGVLSAPIYILAALNRNERYSVALMLRKKYSERNS